MKTNKLVARLRVQKLPEYSETQKGYIISLLAEQAAKVFEGLLKENDELYQISQTDENCEPGQIEFAITIALQTRETRDFIRFLTKANNLISERLKSELI